MVSNLGHYLMGLVLMTFLMILLIVIIWFPLHIYFIETKWLPLFRLWLKLFYKVEVRGLENFPKSGPCLLACNHYSFLDWLIVMVVLPRPVHFIIDYNYYEAPGLNLILKKVGAIPIAGGADKPQLLKQAFVRVGEDLSTGKVVLIFPEGAITRRGNIQKFRKGIVKIKANNSAPVIPMSIDGLWGSLFSFSKPGLFSLKKINFKKRTVKVHIYPEYKNVEDLDGLKSIIFSDIQTKNNNYVLT